MNKRELATVLAALRYWQQARTANNALDALASNDGEFVPLSPAEVDTLCERMNAGQPEEAPRAILPDTLLGHAFWEEGCLTVGEHDGPGAEAHAHWSIATIVDGVVTGVDWGYHSPDEAASSVTEAPAAANT